MVKTACSRPMAWPSSTAYFPEARIVAATESADCERAICRNLQADSPHRHDEDHSPSPTNQKFSATVTSSGSGRYHLVAEDLVTGPPVLGTRALRVF